MTLDALVTVLDYGSVLIFALTGALVTEGFAVFLADPRQIRAFRTAEGRIAKTDRLDAGLIARFARTMPERLRPTPDADQVALEARSPPAGASST